MNDTPTSIKQRKTRYDLNFKRSAVELWQSSEELQFLCQKGRGGAEVGFSSLGS
jgi:hypothetical protein